MTDCDVLIFLAGGDDQCANLLHERSVQFISLINVFQIWSDACVGGEPLLFLGVTIHFLDGLLEWGSRRFALFGKWWGSLREFARRGISSDSDQERAGSVDIAEEVDRLNFHCWSRVDPGEFVQVNVHLPRSSSLICAGPCQHCIAVVGKSVWFDAPIEDVLSGVQWNGGGFPIFMVDDVSPDCVSSLS